jgi:hypothetical protein
MKANKFITQMNLFIEEYSKSNGVALTGINFNVDIVNVGVNRKIVVSYNIDFTCESLDLDDPME